MKFVKSILNKFWSCYKVVVRNNLKYKNIHKGKTCLIFANGGSLKYYNFNAIGNHISIGCSYSLADKRIAALGMTYCVISDAYLLYPFRLDSYSKKLIINAIGPILKKIIRKNINTKFFTSLTNYYAFLRRPDNLNYFHHFGDKESGSFNLAGNFSNMSGALDIMLGLAKYMGFAKVILLGCDYLGSPKLEGHFYSDEIPVYGRDDPIYSSRIKEVAGALDVLVILPKGSSCTAFESATFEECFGVPDSYQENTEIIDDGYLVMMRKAATTNQIFM